jgi:hypothetical protein
MGEGKNCALPEKEITLKLQKNIKYLLFDEFIENILFQLSNKTPLISSSALQRTVRISYQDSYQQ